MQIPVCRAKSFYIPAPLERVALFHTQIQERTVTLSHKTNSNRYLSSIDNYHVEVGTGSCNLFHICEFAERMEASCAMVEPAGAVIEHNQESREKDRSDAR